MKYAAADLAALAACFGVMSPVVVDHPWLLPLYAPLTGTVMWMNFVVDPDVITDGESLTTLYIDELRALALAVGVDPDSR